MGFLDSITGKGRKQEQGVCIPEPRQKIAQEEAERKKQEEAQRLTEEYYDNIPRFRITGLYSAGGNINLLGEVISGKIKVGSKIAGRENAKVKALSLESKGVKELSQGQSGVLHLNTANDSGMKAEEVIEFER